MKEHQIETLLKDTLKSSTSPETYNSYFKNLKIKILDENKVEIGVKNSFIKYYIESKFKPQLNTNLNNILGKDVSITFSTTSTNNQNIQQPPNKIDIPREKPKSQEPTSISTAKPHINKNLFDFNTSLNPNYTFETFIPGSSNLLAHAASQAVAENPGHVYNPLFIHGNVGLGKTHLMQSIGNQAKSNNTEFRILYCTTEQFLNDMVMSIKTQKSLEFRSKYRSIDLLLLDDIQFISKKEALQEEFFNTFNTLYQSNKQIVIASDRPPTEIQHLEDRIRSRFEGGLVADVKNPDFETRIAILQKKAQFRKLYLSDKIFYRIAELVTTNIRELEGALLKIAVISQSNKNNPITVSDVDKILNIKTTKSTRKVSYTQILKDVAEYFDIPVREIKSSKRDRDITLARHISMYLLKRILNLNLVKIATHLGRKDHTTVIHGIRKIEKTISDEINPDVTQLINEITLKYR